MGKAQVVTAFVPLASMFGYIENLRGMSQGRTQFTMQYDHYEAIDQDDDPDRLPPAIAMRA